MGTDRGVVISGPDTPLVRALLRPVLVRRFLASKGLIICVLGPWDSSNFLPRPCLAGPVHALSRRKEDQ